MRMELRNASGLAKFSGKSNNNVILHTSEFKCMLNILWVRRHKDYKVRKF